MDLTSLEKVYNGKKVFVTGHTGFKGSWFTQWLYLLGAEIKGYALSPQKDDLYNLLEGDALCESVIGDICDKEKLEEAILSFQPDFIFHLAAQPLVRLSYHIPSETFAVNVLGTAYVLDAVKQLQKKCTVILITTDKVYENKEWIYPYREDDQLGGSDPYSASKACAEILIESYKRSFFSADSFAKHKKGIASTRAGNVIGGGDWSKDRIIPDIARALLVNNPVLIRNPHAVRPWQHVLEPLGGYLLLGARVAEEPEKFSGAWNFGPYEHDNKKVIDIVKLAIEVWGSGSYQIAGVKDEPHEANLLKLDISKTSNLLPWKPKFCALEAIEHTMEWYKVFAENSEAIKDFTISQIHAYTGQLQTV